MEKKIREIETKILECRAIMAKSDERAAKCSKLNISFQETYPQDLIEYKQANMQNNLLENELEKLYNELKQQNEIDEKNFNHEQD